MGDRYYLIVRQNKMTTKYPEGAVYISTDFYWNNLVKDPQGKIWVGHFDSFSKQTSWEMKVN
jgi:hypothetical protein